jgi:hypothetical protein
MNKLFSGPCNAAAFTSKNAKRRVFTKITSGRLNILDFDHVLAMFWPGRPQIGLGKPG